MPAPVLKERLLAVVCSFGNKAPHFARRQSRKEYALSTSIINAIRKIDQLHGSLFQAAKELAHRADGFSGQIRMSYSMLAWKCHQSRRTAIRHIQKLISLGIIVRERFWRPGNKWGINLYRFVIQWERPTQMYSSDTFSQTLPNPRREGERKKEEREKFGSQEDEKKAKEMVLEWLTPGSALWKLVNQ